MKNVTLLMLPLAISASLMLGACDRNSPADPAPMAPEPAAMPAEPAPAAPVADQMPMDSAAPMDSNMTFAEMDKNADGGIAHDELADSEMLHQHFEAADTDKDGKLSAAEVDKHRADMAAMPAN